MSFSAVLSSSAVAGMQFPWPPSVNCSTNSAPYSTLVRHQHLSLLRNSILVRGDVRFWRRIGNQKANVSQSRGDQGNKTKEASKGARVEAKGDARGEGFVGAKARMKVSMDLKARPEIEAAISDALNVDACLRETNLDKLKELDVLLGRKQEGKVRDIYDARDKLVAITTDRQSAFDRVLASIPFKGQVLNETSAWWFATLAHLTDSAFLSAPHPNTTIFKKCSVFPVEFVVRGYITGSTETSLWTVYKKGIRNYCGNELPEGLVKNQKLELNLLTPTTKAADGDKPVSPAEIVASGLMSESDFQEVAARALAIFEFGQKIAAEHGLILVDTKYEFGKDSDGNILLLDEVHTPDSSRYWLAESYAARHAMGEEPENIDKEFLRLWFKANCDPYNDPVLPTAPKELVTELSWRYIVLFETITGRKFSPPSLQEPIEEQIRSKVLEALL